MLPALKQHYPWLSDVSSVPLQQALRHLDRAFVNFFEGRADYPTFKKKQNATWAAYASNAFTWDGQSLTLAKMDEPLTIQWHRPLPKDAKPSSVTITKDSAGRYFVSILIAEHIQPLPVTPQMVWLDLGINSMLPLSPAKTARNPGYFSQESTKLPRASNRHAW